MGTLFGGDSTAGLQQTDLALWGVVVLIFAVALTAFSAMRWLLHRRWHRPTINRLLWLLELLLLPAVIVGGRELLLDWSLMEPFADVIGMTTGAIVCLALAWLVDRAVSLFVLAEDRPDRRSDVPGILRTAIRAGIYVLAALAFLTLVLEGTTVGFVVSWSVVFGVFGLALQGLLQDAFAGISISIEEPFRLGDWIELDDGTVGQVVDISWRATRLLSFNNSYYVIPNARASNARIHNMTRDDPHYALWVDVYMPNEVDPAMARRLLLEAALATPGVLHEPAPSVNLVDGGSRPCRYMIHFYCADYAAHFVVRSKLFDRVWRYLRQMGVSTVPPAEETWLRRSDSTTFREENTLELLRQTPLFEPLTDKELSALHTAVHYRVFAAGVPVVRQGESGESLFVIAGGQLQVQLGRRKPELARLGRGQYFGETSLLTGAPRTATVTTVTECALIEVGKDALMPILTARPELGEELARVEAERQLEVERAGSRQRRGSSRDVRARARDMLDRIQRFFRLDEDDGSSV